MTRDQEIAWLAGLLEGEGYFQAVLHSSCRTRLRVRVKMTDLDVLQRAMELVGGGALNAIKLAQPHYKPCWELQFSGQDAESVMRAVLPYMGKRRSARIKELLAIPNCSHTPKPKVGV